MIEVKDLTFTYPGAISAGTTSPGPASRSVDAPPTLKDLSFTVAAGEIFGFLGPSGAGKSTTQRILYRLLGGYTGEVRIANRNLREWDTSLYAMTGIGFETPNLYTRLTGRENLLFANALRGDDARSLTADLDGAARRFLSPPTRWNSPMSSAITSVFWWRAGWWRSTRQRR